MILWLYTWFAVQLERFRAMIPYGPKGDNVGLFEDDDAVPVEFDGETGELTMSVAANVPTELLDSLDLVERILGDIHHLGISVQWTSTQLHEQKAEFVIQTCAGNAISSVERARQELRSALTQLEAVLTGLREGVPIE